MLHNEIELFTKDIADSVLDFGALFSGYSKIDLEIGFCSGEFLAEYANANKDTAFIGIEKKHKYLLRGRKILMRRLTADNVRILCFDAMPVIEMLVPEKTLNAIHIYFPDPWPKKRHNDRRTVRERNLRIMWKTLIPGGRIYIATDHPDYAEFMRKEIPKTADIFRTLPYSGADRNIKTKWEKKQIEAGWQINYFLLEKI